MATLIVNTDTGVDYASLALAEAALPATLTEPYVITCGGVTADGIATITAITTTATNDLTITASPGYRHNGVFGAGYVCGTLTIGTINHVTLEGLEISSATVYVVRYSFGTFTAAGNKHIIKNVLYKSTAASSSNYSVSCAANLLLTISNTVGITSSRIIDTRVTPITKIYNSTFFQTGDQLGLVGGAELECYNTYVGKSSGSQQCFWTGGSAPTGSNNAASDSSVATDYTASLSNVSPSSVFAGLASDDFSIAAGGDLTDAGTYLADVLTDITGATRPDPPSIGAFDVVASGGDIINLTAVAMTAGGKSFFSSLNYLINTSQIAFTGKDITTTLGVSIPLTSTTISMVADSITIDKNYSLDSSSLTIDGKSLSSTAVVGIDLVKGTLSFVSADLGIDVDLKLEAGFLNISGKGISINGEALGKKLSSMFGFNFKLGS